jgi:hypothetical protein
MRIGGKSSDLVSYFRPFFNEKMRIMRESCESGWDRDTGKRKRLPREKIDFCGKFKPRPLEIIQDSGGERARGQATITSFVPIYTSDQRDNASADIIMARGKFWKVMDVTDNCSYFKARVELMHSDECDASILT